MTRGYDEGRYAGKSYRIGKRKYLRNKKRPYEKYRYGALCHTKDKSTHGHGGYYR